MQDAKRKREDLGVELFGFQQQLRGIFQSLDEGAERDSQLKTLNGLVKRNLEEKMRHVAHAQSAIADSGVQVSHLWHASSFLSVYIDPSSTSLCLH